MMTMPMRHLMLAGLMCFVTGCSNDGPSLDIASTNNSTRYQGNRAPIAAVIDLDEAVISAVPLSNGEFLLTFDMDDGTTQMKGMKVDDFQRQTSYVKDFHTDLGNVFPSGGHYNVRGLSGGTFILAYQDSNNGNEGRFHLYQNDFTRLTSTPVTFSTPATEIQKPMVRELSNGNLVIIWAESNGVTYDMYFRLYNQSGTPLSAITLVDNTVDANITALAALTDGGFAVFYSTTGGSAFYEIFTNTGTTVLDKTLVTSNNVNWLYGRVTPTQDGGFAVLIPDLTDTKYYLKRFTATGTATGSTDVTYPGTSDLNSGTALVQLSDGRFVAYVAKGNVEALASSSGTLIGHRLADVGVFTDDRMDYSVNSHDNRFAMFPLSNARYFALYFADDDTLITATQTAP